MLQKTRQHHRKAIIRYAAYARISSSSKEQLQPFASQLCSYNTMFDSVMVEMYADDGITGSDVNKREDFKRIMADAEKHKFDHVIRKSITRFARNAKNNLI
ncbi:MAG: recombinase family protein, partial [Ruminiclostridium sp.]|nr:recombinase family protein [Ruminiclostridium sp.]